MRIRRHIAVIVLALVTAQPVLAQTYRVDDSASQVLSNRVKLELPDPTLHGIQSMVASGEVSVLVRLNVAPWKGRQARIYMTLPEQPGGQITTSWTTQGRLLPGVLRSGERTLVYAGPIMGDMIEDTFRQTIQADSRRLVRDEQLAFSFEIDLETP